MQTREKCSLNFILWMKWISVDNQAGIWSLQYLTVAPSIQTFGIWMLLEGILEWRKTLKREGRQLNFACSGQRPPGTREFWIVLKYDMCMITSFLLHTCCLQPAYLAALLLCQIGKLFSLSLVCCYMHGLLPRLPMVYKKLQTFLTNKF